jgi:hypothetical protein
MFVFIARVMLNMEASESYEVMSGEKEKRYQAVENYISTDKS